MVTLLGFNPASAGGIMGVEFVACPSTATVDEALAIIGAAENVQPEALLTVHVVDEAKRLAGVVSVIGLLQAEPETRCGR